MQYRFSASIMCADWMNFERDIRRLEEARVDYIHCDVMDGHFVPNLMVPGELINAIARTTSLPLDVHLMVERPEWIIDRLNLRDGDMISIHHESTVHADRALGMVKQKGIRPILALNPSTPIESVRDELYTVDAVLLMTVNPGYAGQRLLPMACDKISRLRSYLDREGYPNVEIEVDGNCSPENIGKMARAGANIFVLGSSAIFRPDMGMQEGMQLINDYLERRDEK